MRTPMLGPEVAARVESMVRGKLRPWSGSAVSGMVNTVLSAIGQLSLASRFALVSAILLIGGMVLLGNWVAGQIEHAVVLHAGTQLTATQLEAELALAKGKTWLVAGGAALAMFGLLYAIVRRSSQVIDEQREALEQQHTALKQHGADQALLNRQNTTLRQQLQLANRRGTELNERFLRRISSDLHDGPAQHLALALLRLDELAPLLQAAQKANQKSKKNGRAPAGSTTSADSPAESPADNNVLPVIRRATSDALREIRNISSGLALPELQKISPTDALGIAARAHERATGTPVAMKVSVLPARLPLPVTICLFRFAQEGLNNAFRHAGGKGQQLSARCNGSMLEVEVNDSGPGFLVEQRLGENERIGLSGLRHRVESLGGSFNIQSVPGIGTRLGVRFPYALAGEKHG